MSIAGADQRHVVYLKEGGDHSDTVFGDLSHLHQNDYDDNFKVFKIGARGSMPPGVRGAPTIFYNRGNGEFQVFEGKKCMELIVTMCTKLINMRNERERKMHASSKLPGRVPPISSPQDGGAVGGRGETFTAALFSTKHRQGPASEPGALQPGDFVGPKVQAADLAAWEAARQAADQMVEMQYGPSAGGPAVGQQQPYYPGPPQQGGYQPQQYQQQPMQYQQQPMQYQPQQQQQYNPHQYNPQQYNQQQAYQPGGLAGNRMF